MQFKHPEILWALFLVLIPILIHLFKLRKYQKESFTNVQILKQIKKQTNKQSQIKKWLILLMRTLGLACLVLAFAQPYFSDKNPLNKQVETVIYIDNSSSMQLQGAKGTLLQEAVNDVLQEFPKDQTFSLFTNTRTYKHTTIQNIKNKLVATPYSADQLSIEEVYITANRLFSKGSSIKNLILFSDFQQRQFSRNNSYDFNSHFIVLKPIISSNVVIDSLFIDAKTPQQYHIKVELQNNDDQPKTPVSLYHNNTLYAKTSAEFKNGKASVNFTLGSDFKNGRIEISDKGMIYDNSLYFSLNAPSKISVLSINGSDDGFLRRIYTSDEFNFTSTTLDQLDYNSLNKQNFIILNQLNTIPSALTAALKTAGESGIKICMIPGQSNNYISQQPLFPFLKDLVFTQKDDTEKHITTIAYEHPLFEYVFDSTVSNFQYPKVESSFEVQGNYQSVLAYQDAGDFLIEVNGHYAFTSALDKTNSNFQSTPLIVPVFYNMAKQSLPSPTLYYTLGKTNTIAVNTRIPQDHVLKVENETESFIPLQINYQNYVSITTDQYPTTEGLYRVMNNNNEVLSLSFNQARSESSSIYLTESHFPPELTLQNASLTFEQLKSENNIDELWKWFVIFALVFLCLELLILKFFK